MHILILVMFGAIGVLARYGVDALISNHFTSELPLSTFIINSVGSLAIGVIFTASNELNIIPPNITTLLTVGLLGGFTTFSAFSIQSLQMLQQGKIVAGAAYFVGSPVAGLLCAFVGVLLARSFWGTQ